MRAAAGLGIPRRNALYARQPSASTARWRRSLACPDKTSKFTTYTRDTAPAASRPVLDDVGKAFGYCMAGHTTLARMIKMEPGLIAALRAGTALPDAKLEALHRFTTLVVRARGFVPEADVDAFLAPATPAATCWKWCWA